MVRQLKGEKFLPGRDETAEFQPGAPVTGLSCIQSNNYVPYRTGTYVTDVSYLFYFYLPSACLTHFSYCCRFLNCSVERALWVGGGGAEYVIYLSHLPKGRGGRAIGRVGPETHVHKTRNIWYSTYGKQNTRIPEYRISCR